MAGRGELSIRLDYYVAPNDPGDELEQLRMAAEEVKQLPSNDMFRFGGFAETLIRGTGDGDVLSNPNGITVEAEAKEKFRKLLHFSPKQATTSTCTRHRTIPRANCSLSSKRFTGRRRSPDSESLSPISKMRPRDYRAHQKLGGGVAVQDRMVLTGERNLELWGQSKARNAPPLRTLIDSGVPSVPAPMRFVQQTTLRCLPVVDHGKNCGGSPIRDSKQNITRAEALRMYTMGSAWFTFAEKRKGSIEVGKLADLAVLNADYLTVAEDQKSAPSSRS
jgi:hypothetical protein